MDFPRTIKATLLETYLFHRRLLIGGSLGLIGGFHSGKFLFLIKRKEQLKMSFRSLHIEVHNFTMHIHTAIECGNTVNSISKHTHTHTS